MIPPFPTRTHPRTPKHFFHFLSSPLPDPPSAPAGLVNFDHLETTPETGPQEVFENVPETLDNIPDAMTKMPDNTFDAIPSDVFDAIPR